MGSLKARLKAPRKPTRPPVTYKEVARPIPIPQVNEIKQNTLAVNEPIISSNNIEVADESNDATKDNKAKQYNLISRGRGRLGTVKTGFRGLLGLSGTDQQRKSLLGE